MPYFYAKLYSGDSALSKAALAVLQPYYFVKEKFLTLKDKHQAYRAMLRHKSEFSSEVKEIDWEQELRLAEEMGKEACSNDFYIRDDYYTRYVENQLDYLKNLYSNVELLQSNEMKDYEMLMRLCHETGIDPYIIFIPTNGYFYDYTGLTADKRYALYDRLVEIADNYGFSYFDMRNREYEPYILFDWIHLGWKGWVYVCEQISYYFGQNRQ